MAGKSTTAEFPPYERGTATYFASLLLFLFEGILSPKRFNSILARVCDEQAVHINPDKLGECSASIPYYSEAGDLVSFTEDFRPQDLILGMRRESREDAVRILHSLAGSIKVPWLFLAAGRAVNAVVGHV